MGNINQEGIVDALGTNHGSTGGRFLTSGEGYLCEVGIATQICEDEWAISKAPGSHMPSMEATHPTSQLALCHTRATVW